MEALGTAGPKGGGKSGSARRVSFPGWSPLSLTVVIKNKSAFRSQPGMELLIAFFFPKELWVWSVRRRGTSHSFVRRPSCAEAERKEKVGSGDAS